CHRVVATRHRGRSAAREQLRRADAYMLDAGSPNGCVARLSALARRAGQTARCRAAATDHPPGRGDTSRPGVGELTARFRRFALRWFKPVSEPRPGDGPYGMQKDRSVLRVAGPRRALRVECRHWTGAGFSRRTMADWS